MTFVGKILVILIMAFSLVFLGVSTVVFTTATSWKAKSDSQKEQIGKIQSQVRDLETKVKDAQSKLDTAKLEHAKLLTEKENKVTELTKKVAVAEDDMTDSRSKLEVAQKNAQTSLTEATARKTEIEALNEIYAKASTQANQFNAQNIELTDNVRTLQREKATAEQNAKDLRAFVAKFYAMARARNIPLDNLDKFDPTIVPPTVEGQIMAVNATSRSFELSIGQDDGLKSGQELFVYRTQPRYEYLGKVKIVSVYPDKAVADLVGKTLGGKKVLEGDIVSSTLNSR